MKPRALKQVRPDKTAIICAWCPDKERADEWALERGYDLSHTICEPCKQAELTAYKKNPPKENPSPVEPDEGKTTNLITEWLAKH